MGYRFRRWWFNWTTFGGRDRFVRIIVLSIPVLACLACAGLPILRAFTGAWVSKQSDLYLQRPDAQASGLPYLRSRVVIIDPENGALDNLQYRLPRELRARKPEEVGAVVWLERGEDKVGGYIGGGSAIQYVWKVTIIDTVDGVLVAERSFRGSEPPGTIYCSENSSCSGRGDYPRKEVLDYLKSLPRK